MHNMPRTRSHSDQLSHQVIKHQGPHVRHIKSYPTFCQVNISGHMSIKVKSILKSIEKNCTTPFTSETFPPLNGHGPCFEMRFYHSDFSRKSASLYIDVAQSYLRKKSKNKKHSDNIIEIPAMNVMVTISYDYKSSSATNGQSTASCSDRDRREIKSMSVQTEMKKIVMYSTGTTKKEVIVASFPQLVSHTELNLREAEKQFLVICVNMSA